MEGSERTQSGQARPQRGVMWAVVALCVIALVWVGVDLMPRDSSGVKPDAIDPAWEKAQQQKDEEFTRRVADAGGRMVEVVRIPRTRSVMGPHGGTVSFRVRFDGPTITAEQLASLKDCHGTIYVHIEDTAITDAMLSAIPVGVTSLNLAGTPVTDAGVAKLGHLKDLNFVGLDRTAVTDAGLAQLPPGVTSLSLAHTKVTDDGVAALARRELFSLDLSGTAVTDAGLAHLKNATRLSWLMLSDTAVTDAGIAHLSGHRYLEMLDLTGTKVTEEGVKALIAAHDAIPGKSILAYAGDHKIDVKY